MLFLGMMTWCSGLLLEALVLVPRRLISWRGGGGDDVIIINDVVGGFLEQRWRLEGNPVIAGGEVVGGVYGGVAGVAEEGVVGRAEPPVT